MDKHEKILFKLLFEDLDDYQRDDYKNRLEVLNYVISTNTLCPEILNDHEISCRVSVLVDSLNLTCDSLLKIKKKACGDYFIDRTDLLDVYYGTLCVIGDLSMHQTKYYELLEEYNAMKVLKFEEDMLRENRDEACEVEQTIREKVKKISRTRNAYLLNQTK